MEPWCRGTGTGYPRGTLRRSGNGIAFSRTRQYGVNIISSGTTEISGTTADATDGGLIIGLTDVTPRGMAATMGGIRRGQPERELERRRAYGWYYQGQAARTVSAYEQYAC